MKKALAALTFLTFSLPSVLGYLPSLSSSSLQRWSFGAGVPSVKVLTGKLSHAQGSIVSHGLYSCSAVILDYGKVAVLAHATPYDRLLGEPFPISPLYVDNVVSALLEYSSRRGLSSLKARAIINAADEPTLQKLIEDFTERGILVAEANTDLSPEDLAQGLPRSVQYDSRTDVLQIYVPGSDLAVIKKIDVSGPLLSQASVLIP